jgi:hypothetical protein
VSETKEKDTAKLGKNMEETFMKCVDVCSLLHNNDMKKEIKNEFCRNGENIWKRAKAAKKQAITWTAMMKPWEPVPSGDTDPDDHNIRKLLDILYEEKTKNGKQSNLSKSTFEPSTKLLIAT